MKYQTFENLKVKQIEIELAKPLILENHYSKTWNSAFGKYCFGIFREQVLLGVAVYGFPMNPKSWKRITSLNEDTCIELNRLWISDQLLKNTETWFLSKTFGKLKDFGIELIQTFADGRLGVGTTYQATNFGYYGYHSTIFHEDKYGSQIHDAVLADTRWHKSMTQKNLQWIRGELKTFEVKTYRYLYPLTRRAKKTINLKQQPYPKDRIGLLYKKDYAPATAQIARCAAICKAMNWASEYSEFFDYLQSKNVDANLAIEKAIENKWVQKLLQAKSASALF